MTVLGKLVFSVAPKKTTTTTNKQKTNIQTNKQTESYTKSVIQITRYRAYSLTCPASIYANLWEQKRPYSLTCSVSMQFMGSWGEWFTHVASIFGNFWELKNFLHKKRVQLPQDLFGTRIWPPWRHVNTLLNGKKSKNKPQREKNN